MHTAIGVFGTRDKAEEAFHLLLERHVPPNSIVFLSLARGQEATGGKELGATVGGFLGVAGGITAGVGTAMLLAVPGIGQVIALGLGAAALLGIAGAGAGSKFGKNVADDSVVQPTPDEKCPEDVAFFRKVLAEGHSLLVVRSESQEVANVANGVLSQLGMSIPEHTPVKMQSNSRHIADIVVIDVRGRITFGDGSAALRQLVRDSLEQGHRKIMFNLREVGYIDSSGLGELVKSYTTVRSQGGDLKLVEVSQRVLDLLHMTKLHLVLEIEPDEASAVHAFGADKLVEGTA